MVLVVKNPPANAESAQKMQNLPNRCEFTSWVGKRRAWQPTPGFLPGEPHGQGSLAGYNPEGHKELDTTEVT